MNLLCFPALSHSFVSDSWQPHGLQSARLLRPWDSPGKNTGVGCHALLQGIFLTQGSNLHLLLGWRILDHGATRKALPCIGIHWKTRHLTEQGRWKRGSGGRQELRVECEGVSKASACRAEDQVIKKKKKLVLVLTPSRRFWGTFIMVQWFGVCTCNARGLGSIPVHEAEGKNGL